MIEVNGQELAWRDNLSVRELLRMCKYSFPLLIVKVNDQLVARSDYDSFKVPDGSKVSVVHLMSGG